MLRWLNFLAQGLMRRRGVDSLPRFLTYTVTFGCNARCIMCDSWRIRAKDDLDLDEIEGIFRQLPRMDAVRLTGGEPFARRDLTEIVGLTQSILRPSWLHITTNGFLTERIVKLCENRSKRTPLHLLVSIDGMKEKHNRVRGTERAWDTAIATLEALSKRQKQLNLRLAVNQTIVDRDSVADYAELHRFLKSYGIKHQVVMAYDQSATYRVERNLNLAPKEVGQFTTFGQFSNEEINDFLETVEADTKQLAWPERWAKRYYLKGIRERLLRLPIRTNPACVALESHLRIFPNGDIPTCQFNSGIVGNLRQQSFQEIWNSQLKKDQRDWVKACAGCWAECEVIPSAIYQLEFLGRSRSSSRHPAVPPTVPSANLIPDARFADHASDQKHAASTS